MSLRSQILHLLLASLVLTIIALSLHYSFYRKRLEVHQQNASARHNQSVNSALELITGEMQRITYDYTFWDELAEFSINTDTLWARQNIASSVDRFAFHYCWVFNMAEHQIYRCSSNGNQTLESPLPSYAFKTLFEPGNPLKKPAHFYTIGHDRIIEIAGAPIYRGVNAEIPGPALGYLVFGRIVDEKIIDKLEKISLAEVEVHPVAYNLNGEASEHLNTQIEKDPETDGFVRISVGNWNQIPVADFTFTFQNSYEENEEKLIRYTLFTYIALAIALFALFYTWVIRKILVPVSTVNKALDTNNPELVHKLAGEKAEFGRMALLVRQFLSQRDELMEEVKMRRETQRILRESEARFRTLSDSAFEGIIIHMNRRIIDVNEPLLAMTDYSIEDVSWKIVNKLLVAPGHEQVAEACFSNTTHQVFEFIAVRKNGTGFPVEARTKSISFKDMPAQVTTIVDISERLKREEEVKILSRAVDSNPASVMITNQDGIIEYVNPKFSEITGYTRTEALGKTPSLLKSGIHSPEYYESLWKWLIGGEDWYGEFCNKKKNGELYWERASISSIRTNDKISHYVAIKEDISEKKRIQEELLFKNSILTDSINYAKRIQEAVMPTEADLRKHFPESSCLYLPRDIVSGDFIWIRQIKNLLYIVVADCTGHGVPGALMSMLGISLLNERVNSSRMDAPHILLHDLRSKVKQALRQTGEMKDSMEGMDISVCSIDVETHLLRFAGAFQSISIVREGAINHLHGDKQPIGYYYEESVFSSQQFSLQKGDILYLYSDGFASQIGGPREKKFSTPKFRALLLEASGLPVQDHAAFLKQKLDEWKRDWEQVDDITLLAVKI